MLTKDDVDQLRQMIREEVEAEGKRIHSDVTLLKTEVKGSLFEVEGSMKDLEISNGRVEKQLKEQGAAITRIEKKLEKEITGNAEAVQEIVAELSRLDDHEARITQLEEDAKFLPH